MKKQTEISPLLLLWLINKKYRMNSPDIYKNNVVIVVGTRGQWPVGATCASYVYVTYRGCGRGGTLIASMWHPLCSLDIKVHFVILSATHVKTRFYKNKLSTNFQHCYGHPSIYPGCTTKRRVFYYWSTNMWH